MYSSKVNDESLIPLKDLNTSGLLETNVTSQPVANFPFLICLTVTMGLSSLNFGVGLAGSGNVAPILAKKFGWGDETTSNTTLLQTCSILGIAVGSILGGPIVKGGKRRAVLIFNQVAILGCLVSIVPQFEVICTGRFIHGFAAGVLCCAAPSIIGETVPEHLMDLGFGVSTNLIIMFGVMTCMLLGAGIPAED